MKTLINRMRGHRNLVLLFISGWLIPLVTELSSSWLQATFGQTPGRLLQLFAVFLALSIGLWVLYRVLEVPKEDDVELVPEESRPHRFPGLIVFIGPGKEGANPEELSHEIAIQYHLDHEDVGGEPLRVCWLIATTGLTGTVPLAREIRLRYQDRCDLIIRELADPFDMEDAYTVVRRIYEQEAAEHQFSPDQIIADFTGGTKPMSVGMALACRDRWPMQYVTGGKPPIASVPLFVHFASVEE